MTGIVFERILDCTNHHSIEPSENSRTNPVIYAIEAMFAGTTCIHIDFAIISFFRLAIHLIAMNWRVVS